jgi:uncharacterized protein YukE
MAAKADATDHKNTADKSADSQKLDSLLTTLDGDLTSLDTEAALNALDEWYGIVHKAHEPEAKELSQNLKELKQLLKSGKATGHEIGEVLIEIGEHTSHIASEAEKGLKTPLQKLGKQLKAAGTSLGKAEDREQIEQIDSLVETLEGDLTSIDSDKAVSAIDHWYTILHKLENENFKEIANELKHLKQTLKSSKAQGADIGEILVKLGEQTQEAAKEAARGIKGPVQRLGKLLSKTGKSLEK